jgi:hypothetical protein
MLHARIMCQSDFFDDVLRRSPDGYTFLWFDAELTSSLVPDTPLVDFNLIGERSWFRLISEIRVACYGFTSGACLGPFSPLFSRPSLMLPCAGLKVSMQRSIGIL